MRGSGMVQRLRALPETLRCNAFRRLHRKRNVVPSVGEGRTPTLTIVRLLISRVFHVDVGVTFHVYVDFALCRIRVNRTRLTDGVGRESTGADRNVKVLRIVTY